MRTAEEIMKANGIRMTDFISSSSYILVYVVINEARKEAIEAAHEMALLGNGQSILSLIKELK